MDQLQLDLDKSLCGTPLTIKKLERLLRNSTKIDMDRHQITSVEANTAFEDKGMASKLIRIEIKWSKSNSASNPTPNKALCSYQNGIGTGSTSLPTSVVVKVICNNCPKDVLEKMNEDEMEKFTDGFSLVHDVECNFYEFEEHRNYIPLPICYGKQKCTPSEPGYLILEDLSSKGVTMSLKTSGVGLNKAQLDQVLDTLTSLHAWSINTNVCWRRTIPTLDKFEILLDWMEHLVSSFPETKDAYPKVFEGFEHETLKKLVNRKTVLDVLGSDPKAKYGLPLVLIHNDCYMGNMMFRKDKPNEYGDLVSLLDWQAACQGCGVSDLARVAIMALSTETRREWTDWMLERYVELFNSKVRKGDKISLNNVKKAFETIFAYDAMVWSSPFLVLLSFASQSKGLTEEERVALKDRLCSYHSENFKDARRILGV